LGPYDLYWKPSNGSGNEELLLKSDNAKFVTDWSSDGRFILYVEYGATSSGNLWALPLFGDQKPVPVVQMNLNGGQGRFSPDGHWIAYAADESGKPQIYVQSFPTTGGKWMVSIDGGIQPRWRQDGKELFYYGIEGKLMVVDVKANADNFQAGTPSPLFEVRPVSGPPTAGPPYSVSHDGQRFLINITEESSPSPAIVVQNWTSSLKK
jgi:Tol biopolymer transport system component